MADEKFKEVERPLAAVAGTHLNTEAVSGDKLAEEADETVTMVFPKDVFLNEGGRLILFKAGTREVPVEYEDHWFFKASGVKSYVKPGKAADDDEDEDDSKDEAPDLDKMTKAQLVEHASEVHGLELDEKTKKEDLVAAIKEAASK